MTEKIIKLAKRLNKFMLEEIEPILNVENSKDVEEILKELVAENILTFQSNTYFYAKQKPPQSHLPNFFQYHTKEEIELIMKCFCAEIKPEQGAFLLGIGKSTLQQFYKYFRSEIYTRQLNQLKEHFEINPKISKMRTFYDVPVYFYLYGGKLFIADKPLKSRQLNEHTKEEKLEIKVLYSRLRRSINHSKMKKFMPHHVAEHIWRYGKDVQELFNIIKCLD